MNILFFLLPKDKIHFVYEQFTLRQVLEKMDSCGFAALPILNNRGEYIDTITEGDILRYIKRHKNLSLKDAERINLKEIDIKRSVKSIKIYANVEDLLEVSLDQNFVPIVDDMNRFIGIITRRSIISYFYEKINEGK
ncbi:MAG: CBS domain-containing protein [Bacilli bacterium]|nr:CBS domain-containing protein [Bacilli bacterium]